jgi:hypothetical protein
MLKVEFYVRKVKVAAWNYEVIYVIDCRSARVFTALHVVLSIGYE